MKAVIDRFEGDFAVLELSDKTHINVPKVLFKDFNEGDVITILKDENETDARREKAKTLFSSLFHK